MSAHETIELDLGSYQWKRRVVLLFAPFVDQDAYVQQKGMLAAAQGGVEDRDIVIVEVVGEAGGAVGDARLGAASAKALRERFRVDLDTYATILVGKDGGEKMRDGRAIPAHRLFERIDTMPMRQEEMAERRKR